MTEPTRHDLAYQERLAVGVAASSGLVMAACISALPAASCTAMAETYGRAIAGFGLPAVIALVLLAIFIPIERAYPRSLKIGRLKLNASGVSLALVCLIFGGAILSSGNNMVRATKHCFIGTAAELAAHAHDRIRLFGPFDWWDADLLPSGTWDD